MWKEQMETHPYTMLHNMEAKRFLQKRLLPKGADPNVEGPNRWTPLHYAAKNNSKEVVELLLQKGADPNVEGADGHPCTIQQKTTARRL